MAGTDLRRGEPGLDPAPVVILVRPQLGENIGTAARAMLNCGLTKLRLVAPRDGWPNDSAVAAASGADVVLDEAQVFATTADATADLQDVLATTARPRNMVKDVLTPHAAAERVWRGLDQGHGVGLLFGAERAGLHNDDIAASHAIIQAPLNPGFSSLNLAQAVLLVAYQVWILRDETPAVERVMGEAQLAEERQVQFFLERLEGHLEEGGFFPSADLKPVTLRNLQSMFRRMGLTDQELRTLHGMVSALTGTTRRGKPRGVPGQDGPI